jgi:hypothetical protein
MQTGFATYEFITYVVPGGVFVFCLMVLFKDVRKIFGAGRIDIGGLGLFLVLSFIAGELFNTIGIDVIQPLLIANKVDLVWAADQKIIPDRYKSMLISAIKRDFGVIPIDRLDLDSPGQRTDNDYRLWQSIVARMRARVALNKDSDRIEIYLQHYFTNINIATSLLFCILAVIPAFIARALRVSPVTPVVSAGQIVPCSAVTNDIDASFSSNTARLKSESNAISTNELAIKCLHSPVFQGFLIVVALVGGVYVALLRAADFELYFARELLLSYALQ